MPRYFEDRFQTGDYPIPVNVARRLGLEIGATRSVDSGPRVWEFLFLSIVADSVRRVSSPCSARRHSGRCGT